MATPKFSVPDTMRALEFEKPGLSELHVVEKRPVPKQGSSHALPEELQPVLIKVEYAALNPVDAFVAQLGFAVPELPHTVGADAAGTIMQASEGSAWQVGQKVWACTGMPHAGGGTLAAYCSAPSGAIGAVTEGMSMQAASTLPLGSKTAAAALWYHLGLSREYKSENEGVAVLVYGASASVGCYAVQLLKIAGYRVIGVASKKHHPYLKELGAAAMFDYRDDDFMSAISADPANEGLRYAFDVVRTDSTANCFEIMRKCGTPKGEGVVVTSAAMPAQVEESMQNMPESELKFCTELLKMCEPTNTTASDMQRTLNDLVKDGKLVPNKVTEIGGLEAARDGLQRLLDGKVSGEKLVVKV